MLRLLPTEQQKSLIRQQLREKMQGLESPYKVTDLLEGLVTEVRSGEKLNEAGEGELARIQLVLESVQQFNDGKTHFDRLEKARNFLNVWSDQLFLQVFDEQINSGSNNLSEESLDILQRVKSVDVLVDRMSQVLDQS